MEAGRADTNAMAFMGDAVYEVFVRRMLIERGITGANKLHRKAVAYVNAAAQAKALKAVFAGLDPDEQTMVRRARNHKTATKARHADPVTYKLSTAFEALIGYLYLDGREERAQQLMEAAVDVIRTEED